ncbi:MAG: glycosyltransferase family 4 protein [Proteobacteria bacterium]|nr:glycosyltransferase family 4 protein [Pseudomonadota bacterium]
MIILTDILRPPIDEGSKVTVYNLLKLMSAKNSNFIYLINCEKQFDFIHSSITLNKLLFRFSFYKKLKSHTHNTILYIPEASITFFSFIRSKLLQIFTKKKIVILSLQPRTYSGKELFLIKLFFKVNCIITQSKKTSDYLNTVGLKNHILPLGVDNVKYNEFDDLKKRRLRKKYHIEYDKTVLLHVGHIQVSRNLEMLIKVKKDYPDFEVIIIGSTYNKNDEVLFKRIVDSGIRVISEYIKNMEDMYNLADFYIFPVLKNDGAIETPLSVLEAMACNLPVITTKFGSLPDVFNEDDFFHFVKTNDDFAEILNKGPTMPCNNKSKIDVYSWGRITDRLIDIIENEI